MTNCGRVVLTWLARDSDELLDRPPGPKRALSCIALAAHQLGRAVRAHSRSARRLGRAVRGFTRSARRLGHAVRAHSRSARRLGHAVRALPGVAERAARRPRRADERCQDAPAAAARADERCQDAPAPAAQGRRALQNVVESVAYTIGPVGAVGVAGSYRPGAERGEGARIGRVRRPDGIARRAVESACAEITRRARPVTSAPLRAAAYVIETGACWSSRTYPATSSSAESGRAWRRTGEASRVRDSY